MKLSRSNPIVRFAKEYGGFKEYYTTTVCDLFSALFVGFLKIFFGSVVVCACIALVEYILVVVTFCVAFSIYCGTWLGDDNINGVCFFLGSSLSLVALVTLVYKLGDSIDESIRLLGTAIKDKTKGFCTIITFKD